MVIRNSKSVRMVAGVLVIVNLFFLTGCGTSSASMNSFEDANVSVSTIPAVSPTSTLTSTSAPSEMPTSAPEDEPEPSASEELVTTSSKDSIKVLSLGYQKTWNSL